MGTAGSLAGVKVAGACSCDAFELGPVRQQRTHCSINVDRSGYILQNGGSHEIETRGTISAYFQQKTEKTHVEPQP
jgi:hypothetical protein